MVWLYFRFLLSLRMVEEMLAARGITVSYETVRQWARNFGPEIANLFRLQRDHRPVAEYRGAQTQAFQVWAEVVGAPLAA